MELLETSTTEICELTNYVRSAIDLSLREESNIDPALLSIVGMSGRRYRHFINNLIRLTPDPKYLEIGCWAGSTLCSAINRNAVRATAIDNWSEYGGPKAEFLSNLHRYKTAQAYVNFVEKDFRAVDYSSLGLFNVYFFDGPHEQRDQHDGLVLVRPALDENFVLIIDDWNWGHVRDETHRAMAKAGIRAIHSIQIRTTLDESHPVISGADSDWHNGYFICVSELTGSR